MRTTNLASDNRLLLAAIVAGDVRWEPFAGQSNRGELCVGGLRWSTILDPSGCPMLHESLRHRIMRETSHRVTGVTT